MLIRAGLLLTAGALTFAAALTMAGAGIETAIPVPSSLGFTG
jgi:hypothetical protein